MKKHPHPASLPQVGEGVNAIYCYSLAHLWKRGLLSLSFFLLPTILFASSTSLLTIKTAEKNISFNVEVAKTPTEQSYGLMNRKNLAKNAGMLFVYDNASELSFWMKNTLIPLDIIFVDASKKIVDIQTMTPCHEVTCPIYHSKKPAQYALEINAGLSRQYNISTGNRVYIPKL